MIISAIAANPTLQVVLVTMFVTLMIIFAWYSPPTTTTTIKNFSLAAGSSLATVVYNVLVICVKFLVVCVNALVFCVRRLCACRPESFTKTLVMALMLLVNLCCALMAYKYWSSLRPILASLYSDLTLAFQKITATSLVKNHTNEIAVVSTVIFTVLIFLVGTMLWRWLTKAAEISTKMLKPRRPMSTREEVLASVPDEVKRRHALSREFMSKMIR